MASWVGGLWALIIAWLRGLDATSVLSFLGEKLLEGTFQAVAVVVIGWLVLYRQWRQITQGRSDQVIFSANLLKPIDGPGETRHLLQLRTVLPPRTVDQLLDNVALRRQMRRLAEASSLADPMLATEGTAGFEIVNDVTNSVAGELAASPFPREPWLMAVTCEDRKVVRKCCIRVLLIRRADIDRLASWEWCRDHLLVEQWYHFWRIVTLHQIALRYREEREEQEQARAQDIRQNRLPLVDSQAHHPRVRVLSLGINANEPILETPQPVDWNRYLPEVARVGLALPGRASGS